MQVTPDWTEIWTADSGEKELLDFEFLGPGWYLSDKDTLLVVPAVDNPNWNKKQPSDMRYLFHCWNVPYAKTIFHNVISIPQRSDTSDETL